MKIVFDVPEEFKRIEPVLQDLLKMLALQTRRSETSPRATYGDFEKRLEVQVAKLESECHGVALSALDVDAPRIRIGTEEFVKDERSTTDFFPKAGPVRVERTLYRRVDGKGPLADPVALRCGAVNGCWLPSSARAAARLIAQGTGREAEATAGELGRLPYSRSAIENLAHVVGAAYVDKQLEVDEALIQEMEVPAEATSVSVALDRVSVPMEEPVQRKPGRPRKDAPKIVRVFHMAYCGTITLHDKQGRALLTIRYGDMPEGDISGLMAGLAGDVLAILERRPDLAVTLLSDGAREMRNLLDDAFLDCDFPLISRLIDFWHLVEKLAAAAKIVERGDDGTSLMGRWKLRLLNSETGTQEILSELRASGRENAKAGDKCPVHEAMTYLENNLDRTNYVAARNKCQPIGSGNVEATCKTLFKVRMDRSGSRWKSDTADHVVHLRALTLSDRFPRAMELTLPRPTPVQALAAA